MQAAVGKAQRQMVKIVELTKEISAAQQIIEERVEHTEVVQEDSSKEYLKLMEEVKVEALMEAEEVAKAHCHKRGDAKNGNDCCADCTKSRWRVPPKELCSLQGCSHGCGYILTTCDKDGKPMEGCATECSKESPFGKTKHSWCKTKSGDVAFCDCPAIQCTCPPNAALSDDGKTCTGASLLDVGPGYPPLGQTQLPQPKASHEPLPGVSLMHLAGNAWNSLVR